MKRRVWSGESDVYVQAALDTLWTLEPDPALCVDAFEIIVADDLVTRHGTDGSASRGRIYVDGTPKNPFYECAIAGDPVPLASLLLHEGFHLRFGRDEAGAYDAQLLFLRRVKAAPEWIAFVEQARARVLAAERKAG